MNEVSCETTRESELVLAIRGYAASYGRGMSRAQERAYERILGDAPLRYALAAICEAERAGETRWRSAGELLSRARALQSRDIMPRALRPGARAPEHSPQIAAGLRELAARVGRVIPGA